MGKLSSPFVFTFFYSVEENEKEEPGMKTERPKKRFVLQMVSMVLSLALMISLCPAATMVALAAEDGKSGVNVKDQLTAALEEKARDVLADLKA